MLLFTRDDVISYYDFCILFVYYLEIIPISLIQIRLIK